MGARNPGQKGLPYCDGPDKADDPSTSPRRKGGHGGPDLGQAERPHLFGCLTFGMLSHRMCGA